MSRRLATTAVVTSLYTLCGIAMALILPWDPGRLAAKPLIYAVIAIPTVAVITWFSVRPTSDESSRTTFWRGVAGWAAFGVFFQLLRVRLDQLVLEYSVTVVVSFIVGMVLHPLFQGIIDRVSRRRNQTAA